MSCSDPSEAASRAEPRWDLLPGWRGGGGCKALGCASLASFAVCLEVEGTLTPFALLTTVEGERQLVPCQDRRCL